jgi:hypothetical protein
LVTVDAHLTLLPARIDLRQDNEGPTRTKAVADIWNSNEVRFSGTERCIGCWDQTRLSLWAFSNHFLLNLLQTDKGKARIDGEGSSLCPGSVDAPLLGLSVKELTLAGFPAATMRTAVPLVGMGEESGRIWYDFVEPPDESTSPVFSAPNASPGNEATPTVWPTASGFIENRASVSKKGSLLVWANVELKWNAQGQLIEDTFLTITNDRALDRKIQFYFVNGDAPLPPVIVNGILLERSHPGWNRVDVQVTVTGDESAYWSAFTGEPKGVSPFTILDPGQPPGRPDLDPTNPGGRVLRGFVLGWAVNASGQEVRWNHLTGGATIVNYRDSHAAGYETWAFQCVSGAAEGATCDGVPGLLQLDGIEYDAPPERLLLDFFAVGSEAFSHPGP